MNYIPEVKRGDLFKWAKEEVSTLIFTGRALGMAKASSFFTVCGTNNHLFSRVGNLLERRLYVSLVGNTRR